MKTTTENIVIEKFGFILNIETIKSIAKTF